VGTLAEVASPAQRAGNSIVLEIILQIFESPESAPLQTEHVVMLKFSRT
jgi:hypothetical protein